MRIRSPAFCCLAFGSSGLQLGSDFACVRQYALGYNVICNGLAAYQVFLNNSFQNCRGAVAIPRAIGVDQRYRAVLAYLQAVRFGSVDATSAAQFQL